MSTLFLCWDFAVALFALFFTCTGMEEQENRAIQHVERQPDDSLISAGL